MRTKLQSRIAPPLAALLLLITTAAYALGFGQPQIGAVKGNVPIIPHVKVVNFGTVIYTGSMDINPTLARIRAGTKVNEQNDGGIFTNTEKLLPVKSDSQYYREFVHAPKGFPFPGPQRVQIGKGGEVYYTGDHYVTAQKVN